MSPDPIALADPPGAPARSGTGSAAGRTRLTRLDSLTGLRFPAALLVFAYHASFMGLFADAELNGDFYQAVAQAGGLGVSFFFVLSGFVLTWSARPGDTARAFWRRRFVKIYPNYVIAWALALIVFASAATTVPQAVANLFMLQVWVPDFWINFGVNPPSWSLAAEAVFYLSFPLLYAGIRRIPADRLKYWTTAVLIAVIATPVLADLFLAETPLIPGEDTSELQYWAGYILPPVRLLDFALGILVARLVLAGRWRGPGMTVSAVLLAGGYALSFWLPYLYGQRATCVIPVILLIAATAGRDVEGSFSPFRNRAMTWLGEISFAFYLLHFIVLKQGREWLGDRTYSVPAGIALIVAGAAVTVLLSWALYALVERPVTRRFSRPRGARSTADTERRPS
ncbi:MULTISPECIES: acyltransferase family protein [Streptomyces]|uniref:acyltransferase family protein n=1 Tax=Streptomyces TaxID=1883 RepID=UPI00146FA6F2|nr:acyltransferase [Streptomyces glaucescens]